MSDVQSGYKSDSPLGGRDCAADEKIFEEDIDENEIKLLKEVISSSMKPASDTLYALFGQSVDISHACTSFTTLEKEIVKQRDKGCVSVKISYTEGITGANVLILNENDANIIADIMAGGDGSNTVEKMGVLQLSAIGEAMNQMIGSASIFMSEALKKIITISPPKAYVFDADSERVYIRQFYINAGFEEKKSLFKMSFDLKIGNLINSKLVQLIPSEFVKEMIEILVLAEKENKSGKKPKKRGNK